MDGSSLPPDLQPTSVGLVWRLAATRRSVCIKVRTDLSAEFGSNPILIDRIRIESAAGSNPILIVQIRTALDREIEFNERVTAFTTGTSKVATV